MCEAISHLRKNHDILVRSLQASAEYTPTAGHDKSSLSLELSRNVKSSTSVSSFDNESLSSQLLPPLCLPAIPDRVSPVYDGEEDEEVTDHSLINDYVLMDLDHETATLPDSVEVITDVSTIIPVSSSPSSSPSFIIEVRRGEGMVFTLSRTAEARSSPPPPKATVAAGWEGWMRIIISTSYLR